MYETAKRINKLISEYLPAKFQINSTDDFLNIIRLTEAHGHLLSLDVESLFTNVPLETTIEIICDNVYSHPTIPPPPFDRRTLSDLLRTCTSDCPFNHMDGKIYKQCDGVSMGSPLGVTFANFYMTHVENQVLTIDK